MSSYRICRDDGISDGIAGQVFDSYDAAYAVVERYYADMCCSDDREYYRIEPFDAPGPRFQESCHPSDPSIRGLEDMTNAPLQRGRQG